MNAMTTGISDDDVAESLRAMGFDVSPDARAGLVTYLTLLMKWNAVMNLTGASDWADALENLVADSLHLAAFLEGLSLPPQPETWDLGAGAGLPGIPLRLVWQEGTYTMIEAREKRALFLRTVLANHPLPRVTVVQARVEVFFRKAAPADLIISRAFMPWREMLDLVAGHLRPAGKVVFLTLEPAPDTGREPLPPGWRLGATHAYACKGRKRFFWCLERS